MKPSEVRFTTIVCDCCGIAMPLEWTVALIEPIVPRFINGAVDLTQPYLNELHQPIFPPVIFSSTEPQCLLDMEDMTEDEQDYLLEENFLPGDCWQEIAEQLSGLVPDSTDTDHPLSCDFCKQAQNFNEPVLLVRHCRIEKAKRAPVDGCGSRVRGTLQASDEYSDLLMCLSCAYLISKEIVSARTINGQPVDRPVWPML